MKLRPCPFCGSSNVKNEWVYAGTDLEEYWVECRECEAKGPWDSNQQQAIEEWNHRTSDEYVTALEAILATLDLDKDTRDSVDRAIVGIKGE